MDAGRPIHVFDAELGWGRLSGDGSRINFFDSPTRPEVALETYGRTWSADVLPRQQRVWWFDGERWLVGRIFTPVDFGRTAYLVEFPNGRNGTVPSEELRVRWLRPLREPVDLVVAGTVETRFFHEHRTAFLREVTRQRSASMGLGGLLSSAVQLHDHQLGAARRVLADPVPRYLLADEVGLGKTIEAGMVLRQLLLNGAADGSEALVLVPDSLVTQWRDELRSKFRANRLPAPVRLMPHSRIAEIPVIGRSLTIVDEAHRLTDGILKGETGSRLADYKILARVASESHALLLLSATPVRSNEDGFLGLLHLLDPRMYRLDDIEGFRRKVEMRDDLAEIMSAVDPDESPRWLTGPLTDLRKLLPNDEAIASYVAGALRAIDDGQLTDLKKSVRALRVHVSEAYRIHRRMIRNRRSQAVKAGYPARGRERSPQWRLVDHDPRRPSILEAMEDFRLDLEASCATGEERYIAARALQCVLGRSLAPVEALRDIATAVQGLHGHDLSPAEFEALRPVLGSDPVRRLAQTIESILETHRGNDLIGPIEDWVRARIGSGKKFALACSFPRTAALIAEVLTERFGGHRVSWLVEGQGYEERSSLVNSFARSSEKNLLVIDRSAEEGVNLQFVHEVVHINIPTSISQLEQRLGRFDRWDELGHPILSTVVTDADVVIGRHLGAWLNLVDGTFKVFTESSATLQYVLADLERHFFLEALTESLLEALRTISGQATKLSEQRKRITGQDALDSIEDRASDKDLADRLSSVDKHAARFETTVRSYIVGMLHFSELSEEPGVIRFGVSKKHAPLLPQGDVLRMEKLLDLAYTSDRLEAAEAPSALGLLRWGEPLVNTFAEYAETDDRGRAFVVELVRPHPNPESDPLVVLCFDFVLSADAPSDGDEDLVRAVATRATSLMPATTERVWWIPGSGECPARIVADVERRKIGGRPVGTNLGSRPDRFRELTRRLDWRAACERSLAEAVVSLRTRPEIRQRSLTAAERARADAERERAILAARGERDGDDERRLKTAVQQAVGTPRVDLESCGAVIITWVSRT